jgi:cell division protein FtsW (lipid II flippase)
VLPKTSDMKKLISLFHWIPRILCILAILFISIFALDSFSEETSFWLQIGAFLVHLIPSFFLLVILIMAWRRELTGGILFLVIGMVLTPFIYNKNYNMNNSIWMSLGIVLMITIPFVVVGVLFIMSHYMKKKNLPSDKAE